MKRLLLELFSVSLRLTGYYLYFLWNETIYEQKGGVAMGSSLSSVILPTIFVEVFE